VCVVAAMQNYEIKDLVGQGTYGRVYRVIRKRDGAELVMKRLSVQSMSEIEQADAENEAQLMSEVAHPTFIQFHDAFLDDGCMNIVMEYAPGGDLAQRIRAQEQTYETARFSITR